MPIVRGNVIRKVTANLYLFVIHPFYVSTANREYSSWTRWALWGSHQLHQGVLGCSWKMEITHGNKTTKAEDIPGEVGQVSQGVLLKRAALHELALLLCVTFK